MPATIYIIAVGARLRKHNNTDIFFFVYEMLVDLRFEAVSFVKHKGMQFRSVFHVGRNSRRFTSGNPDFFTFARHQN